MKIKFIVGIIFLQVILFAYNFFSPLIKFERINVRDSASIQLAHQNIIINSEKISKDSLLFFKNSDYKIDYQNGLINFNKKLGNIQIEYMIYPANLINKFCYYQVQEFSDSTKIEIPQTKKRLFYHDSKLNISGNKTISISVSNDNDFDLDQSLFLKIDGELSKDVHIEAQLNDSQSPITPEGNSRQLSSLDQVFLRVFGKHYEIAFGDLEMEFSNTKFMNYSPKFEGLKIGWQRENFYAGAMAISKGKKTTINFNGLEAKQGPYYLNTEELYSIQVVPGSENVHLNGVKMQRGSDYTIDYSEGSITFTNEHFISASSYIQVSFQFSDQNFKQNLYIASTEINIFENLKFRSYLMTQNDDKENPLSEVYSEDEIAILKNSGDEEAWIGAIYEVIGGDYKLSENSEYYIFVGNDSTQIGEYNLHFTEVENGDYNYNSEGDYYEYVGENEGNYLPIKELIKPINQTNFDTSLNFDIGFLKLNSEALITYNDENSFSKKDSDDDIDFATNISVEVGVEYDLLKPQLKLSYEKLGKYLQPFADIQDPIYNYEVIQIPDSLESYEYSLDFSLDVFDFYKPQLLIKNKNISDFSELNYFIFSNQFWQRKYLPQIYQKYLFWKNNYQNGLENSEFFQHNLQLYYKLFPLEFNFDFFQKEKTIKNENITSQQESFSHYIYKIGYSQKAKYSTQIFFKDEYQNLEFDLENIQKKTKTIGVKSIYSSSKHRINAQLSHREVVDSVEHKYDMADITIHNSWLKNAINLNSYYSLKNLEFYPKIKEFQEVGDNLGSYDEDSLFVGFGEGDYDWIIIEIDYDNPQMSVQVNSNFNFVLNPGNIVSGFWKRFQMETHLQISENSNSENKAKIYLLNPEFLMNENSTIYGKNLFQQTLWLDIFKNKLTSKMSYKDEEILDNRYNEISEKRLTRIWQARFTFSSLHATNLELLYENRFEQNSRYDSEIKINTYELGMSNRRGRNTTFRTSLIYSKEYGNENDESENYQINSYEFDEKITYFWKNKYRILSGFSFKKNEKSGSNSLEFLYEKRDGNIFKWFFNVNYRMNNYTSVDIQYSGNSYPLQDYDVHKLSVEVIAEF